MIGASASSVLPLRSGARAPMASGTGSSPPPETGAPPVAAAATAEEKLEQAVEGAEEEEDAFDIPSKNASHDCLRRWRVRRLVSTNTA